jgi:cysteine desulfurase/selenocysteine lyase
VAAGQRVAPYNRDVADFKPSFDLQAVRAQFPILSTQVDGKPLVYLDNGATTQKPLAVIEAMDRYYRTTNANIHRAVHRLSQAATEAYESTRLKVRRFLNAHDARSIIFTRGTTESINLVAQSLGGITFKPGDEIVLTTLEHHSNIVPWQLAARLHGATIKVIPIDERGELDYASLDRVISARTKLVAFTHTSNALGTIVDPAPIIARARSVGALTLIDGAQWVGHAPTDVQALGCDFYVFSAHKLFGPTGVGVLWGRRELLDAMPPYQGGGDMIRTVSFEGSTWAELPNKFEAGTPDIAGVIGLGAAIDYIASLDHHAIRLHEQHLLAKAAARLGSIKGLRIIGTAPSKASIVSFVMDEPAIDHHTLGTLLDGEGIAVRTGHHCCMPLMDRLGLPGTVRASMSFYNSAEDIEALARGIEKIRASFAPQARALPRREGVAVVFAEASAASVNDAARVLVDDFDLFDDWDQKHDYLIDLGKKIAPLPASEKTEATRVRGCQSTVHLVARRKPDAPDRIEIAAESDAFIVNGLIALMLAVYSGQSAREILAFDVEAFLDRLGLKHHLSMGRRNGLASMIDRIKLIAKAVVEAGS